MTDLKPDKTSDAEKKRHVRKRKNRRVFVETEPRMQLLPCPRYDLVWNYLSKIAQGVPGEPGTLLWRANYFFRVLEEDASCPDAVASLAKYSIAGLSPGRLPASDLIHQARKMFLMHELEASFVLFSRASRLQPSVGSIRNGALLAKASIRECIGGGVDNFDEIIRLYPDLVKHISGNMTMSRTLSEQRLNMNSLSPRRRSAPSVCLLSGEDEPQSTEKNYLMTVPLGTKGRNQEVLGTMAQIAEFMNKRQDLWQRQRQSPRQRKMRLEDVRIVKQRRVKEILAEMDTALKAKDTVLVQQLGSNLSRYLDDASDMHLPNKQACSIRNNTYLSLAHTENGRYDLAMAVNDIMLNVAANLNDPTMLALVYSTTGRTHAAFGNFRWAADNWESMVPLVDDSETKAWLFHELGRCYFQMEQVLTARDYGSQALEAAKEAASDQWALNAALLVAQTEMHMGHHSAALAALQEAQDFAITLKDLDAHRYILNAQKVAKSGALVISIVHADRRPNLTHALPLSAS